MGLTSVQAGVLGSGTFIGYFVGAMLAGMFGDIIGRRKVMMYALVIYCVASLASALANDWGFFLATRIVAGLGTGAESAIVAPFLSEFVARKIARGHCSRANRTVLEPNVACYAWTSKYLRATHRYPCRRRGKCHPERRTGRRKTEPDTTAIVDHGLSSSAAAQEPARPHCAGARHGHRRRQGTAGPAVAC